MARYIDAEKLLKTIDKQCSFCCPKRNEGLAIAQRIIMDFLPADVQEVKHGRWKRKEIHTVWGIHWEYECTNCGIICPASPHYHELVGHDYCPHCGAKMDLR